MICGTREYLAPEVLSANYSAACDYWQFGCFIYEMLVGLPPFYLQENLFEAIMNEEPNYPGHLSYEAVYLISQLLIKDPTKRLTDPNLIKQHPFFKGVNWANLITKRIKPPYKPKLNSEEDTTHFVPEGQQEQEIEEEFKEEIEQV